MFGGICWYIWRSRNEECFWDDDDTPQRSALERARSWLNMVVAIIQPTIQSGQAHDATRHCKVQWISPPLGWVKVNSDVAQARGNRYMSVSGLMRDKNGQWLGGFGKFLRICSVFEAEL
ncbi:hypothetical protein V6N11_064858 [Hibiscus sabdariffa]|uniref:Uncharacterized protein n=2 Tax=Hibiscus sabdariffa TaxID=183260 RepID=A0ABR2SI98_9ROSI